MLCLKLFSVSNLKAIEIIDARGVKISLNKPAKRIISLYGAITDILLDLGLKDNIVGWTKQDKIEHSTFAIPQIGTHLRPNLEKILALKPDLILQMGKRPHSLLTVSKLENFQLKVALFNPANFKELFSCIQKIGLLTGKENKSKKLILQLKTQLEQIKLPATFKRPTIFFEVRYPNLLGAGENSFVSEIIYQAGGINVLSQSKKLVRLSEEELLQLNPTVYIVQKGPMNPIYQPLDLRPLYKQLRATQEKNILLVEERLFSRPGPKSVQAALKLHSFLKKKGLIP